MAKLALGLNPLTEERKARQAEKLAAAPSYRIDYAWAAFDSMPSLRWSDDFETVLSERSELREKYNKAVKAKQQDVGLTYKERRKRVLSDMMHMS